MKKIFKNNGEDFSAINEAREWLDANGFSIGSMETSKNPIGVHHGDVLISKWTRMTGDEQESLDGHLMSQDFRNSDVILTLKSAPKKF